jgi:hypothetical protein
MTTIEHQTMCSYILDALHTYNGVKLAPIIMDELCTLQRVNSALMQAIVLDCSDSKQSIVSQYGLLKQSLLLVQLGESL